MPNDGIMRVRLPNGTWLNVGDLLNPIHLRNGSTWELFGGGPGGQPLKVRHPNGTWKQVSTTGLGLSVGSIRGNVHYATSGPAPYRLVYLYAPTIGAGNLLRSTQTDINGNFEFTGLATYAGDLRYGMAFPYSVLVFEALALSVGFEYDLQIYPDRPDAVIDMTLPPQTSEVRVGNVRNFRVGQYLGVQDGYQAGNLSASEAADAFFYPPASHSVSSSGLVGDGIFHWRSFAAQLYSWVSVPVASAKTKALADFYTGDHQDPVLPPIPKSKYYPGAKVGALRVEFDLSGSSYNANTHATQGLTGFSDYDAVSPFYFGLYADPDFVLSRTQTSGLGNVDFLGPTPTDYRDADGVPVVRGKTLTKEPGVPIWADSLWKLDGVATTATHTLTAEQANEEALEYTVYVSDAPAAPPLTPHITPGFSTINQMQAHPELVIPIVWGT